MKEASTKTTKSIVMVTWNITLQSDDGKSMAQLTALLDSAHPRGNINMVVTNKKLYDENSDEINTRYEEFSADVAHEADKHSADLLKIDTIEVGGNDFTLQEEGAQ